MPERRALGHRNQDLEEFCEKHYEKLLPIMADKYEYEKRKKEKPEEVKARLDLGEARKKRTRAPCSRDSEAEDGVLSRILIAVRKAQGTWKITLKAKIVKGGIGSLNYERKSPMLKMMISPNLGYAPRLIRSRLESVTSTSQKHECQVM
ncbi:hypothetical protein Tco_1487630 [Tanacetum coccineum]